MSRKRKYTRSAPIRKKPKKNPLEYIALPKVELESGVKRSIFIILLFALAVISFLGLLNLSGNTGKYLADTLLYVFGFGKWFFPVILAFWAFLLYKGREYRVTAVNYIGLVIFFISYQTLLHFFIPFQNWEKALESGSGGGYIGMQLTSFFQGILGFWGGVIVLIAFFFISLVLILNSPLSSIIGRESIFGKAFRLFFSVIARLFRSDREYVDEKEYPNEPVKEIKEEVEYNDNMFAEKELEDPAPVDWPKEEKPGKQEKLILKENKINIDLPLSLLSVKSDKPTSGDIKGNALIIQKTLANFGISVEMDETSIGPTITQYSFKPAEGVKLSKITTLSNDLSLALAIHPIRIEAPIPGKALVGIEVPNKKKAIVGLREILEDDKFKHRNSNLMIALGKDVSGENWIYDISKMPHLLVAGATNSGKSVCLNAIIISLLYQNNPDDLRFIMVDPKRVELPIYNGIPHLLTPVITDVSKTINALKWCLNEMDRRFDILSKHKKRNIQSYNEYVVKKGDIEEGKLPYIIFIIDELADLMVTAARDIEGSIIRLAQMARAVGIHLILATQRPSVDVITGLIKANTPSRIAFAVASSVDSKTILDSSGAEKLLGQGDMLLTSADISQPKRIQGAFVSDDEIRNIINYIKQKSGGADYLEGVTERQKVSGMGGVGLDGTKGDEDDLLSEAKDIVINMGKASASLLQRKLRIGYSRAASILDTLEESGVIGPSQGSKPREILISREQYANLINQEVSGASLHKKEESEAPEHYLSNNEEDISEESNDEEDEDDGGDVDIPEEDAETEEENTEEPKKEKTSKDTSSDEDEMFFAK